MPYIKTERRLELIPLGSKWEAHSAGELNYLITELCIRFIQTNYRDLNYDAIANITGVLENVKQEFYRRVAAPYEDHKKETNGDVF